MTYEIINFVELLKHAHEDNKRLYYFAAAGKNESQKQEIMPVTPLIFELFIYNSIYEIDWSQSLSKDEIITHTDLREGEKQKALEKFLQESCSEEASPLYEAFSHLGEMKLTGDWTLVQPDARINSDKGKQFFNLLQKIKTKVVKQQPIDPTFFMWIEQCRGYVYLVRNNIFHGSKRLGETYEPDQRKRIGVYLMFLRGLTSLFFKVMENRIQLINTKS